MSASVSRRSFFVLGTSAAVFTAASVVSRNASACCPAPPEGKPVVNADQTVLIVWDSAKKLQHFVRQASFKGASDDFGFLIPTPTAPELNESGDAAFPLLAQVTAPKVIARPQEPASSCIGGCGDKSEGSAQGSAKAAVRVLSEKTVAGFDASVLEADSTGALVGWLKQRGYAFSPEVEAWAKPYVDGGWKITALRVAKKPGDTGAIEAQALRMSFTTDRPLFPYREPAPPAADKMGDLKARLLRIYFLSDGRYQGALTPEVPWTGKVAWAGKLGGHALQRITEALAIPPLSSETEWLTEFEDPWPYTVAPADLYFAKAEQQERVERAPVYGAISGGKSEVAYALTAAALLPIARRLLRNRSTGG